MNKEIYDITKNIFKILNNVKGFDAAIGNPHKGTLIVRHNNIDFSIKINPIFNLEGSEAEVKPFDEVVQNNAWMII